jgi:prepilin-type processing-associated H-X9-DG protein
MRNSRAVFAGYLALLLIGCAFEWVAGMFVGKGPIAPIQAVFVFVFLAAGCLLGFLSLRILPEHQRRERRWEPPVLVGLALVISTIVNPVLASARVASTRSQCLSHVKDLAKAQALYSGDFDDKLPPADSWRSSTSPFIGDEKPCPNSTAPYSHAFNRSFGGKSLANIADATQSVSHFEADAYGPNANGGKDWFAPRHSGTGSLGYIDGHATFRSRDNAEDFWD